MREHHAVQYAVIGTHGVRHPWHGLHLGQNFLHARDLTGGSRFRILSCHVGWLRQFESQQVVGAKSWILIQQVCERLHQQRSAN